MHPGRRPPSTSTANSPQASLLPLGTSEDERRAVAPAGHLLHTVAAPQPPAVQLRLPEVKRCGTRHATQASAPVTHGTFLCRGWKGGHATIQCVAQNVVTGTAACAEEGPTSTTRTRAGRRTRSHLLLAVGAWQRARLI